MVDTFGHLKLTDFGLALKDDNTSLYNESIRSMKNDLPTKLPSVPEKASISNDPEDSTENVSFLLVGR